MFALRTIEARTNQESPPTTRGCFIHLGIDVHSMPFPSSLRMTKPRKNSTVPHTHTEGGSAGSSLKRQPFLPFPLPPQDQRREEKRKREKQYYKSP
ncbi:unnamed protein product [Periconia digitata]|uniref:Uncharacterized protein n=1 Tax=Periconia digitata TaxID=1303443 RepID=A0A9W4XQ25_9PLEO|nr:unnamed protein product [Periconia digitata]